MFQNNKKFGIVVKVFMNKTKKNISSVEGFMPRRSGDQLGGLRNITDVKPILKDASELKLLHTTGSDLTRDLGKIDNNYELGKSVNDEKISTAVDNFFEVSPKKLSRKEKKLLKKQNKKPKPLAWRIAKWVIWIVVIGLFGFGGYMGYKFLSAGNSVFLGNIYGILQSQQLKQDINGRSNFLVLGTSEDDPGHEGANLTDSMMIVSIDQTKKDAFMFSIPRDLYVEYGMACSAGYQGKINEYFLCSNEGDSAADEQDRLTKTQSFVGSIFGLDIQYGIHINQTVIKQIVDAVGGVDVDVQGSGGAPGVLDRNADWRCNYECYYVKYDNGIAHLDGEHALYLSMARGHDAPTYGLARSNFDREINQQKILMAVKEKAMTTGVLTNLNTVTKLIDALGNNLRTNIKMDEIRTLMQLGGDIKSSDIHSVSLIDGDGNVMTTGMYGDASVVMPTEGIFQYDNLQSFIKNNLLNYSVINEAAKIVVLNGSGQEGLGSSKASILSDNGLDVVLVGNVPDNYTATKKVEIYQIEDNKTATASSLEGIFNTTILKSELPVSVNGDVSFVIIFGPIGS